MKKKLIEVALPLEVLNEGSKPETENPFLRNHPRSIHNWWARTPLSICRAILFAQLVDDPSAHPEEFPTEEDQDRERERLFHIVEGLAQWDGISDEKLLRKAQREIEKYAPEEGLPPVIDPFCGRGSIPLEVQRLGLKAYASDLNPVAVLITKALIEIPPKFAGQSPVNPKVRNEDKQSIGKRKWKATSGLIEDIRYYGSWVQQKAKERVGHLYPKVTITDRMLKERSDLRQHGYKAGDELTVIAWLWARTVPSPNPAAESAHVPLIRSFWLSKKKGEKTWIEPIVDKENLTYRFDVHRGEGKPRNGTYQARKGGICIFTDTPISISQLRDAGKKKKVGKKLLAIIADGSGGPVYLSPQPEHEAIISSIKPKWAPVADMPKNPRWFSPPGYGFATYDTIFTDRQIESLVTLSDLVQEVHGQILHDASTADISDVREYADAVVTYLACAVSRLTDYSNALTSWNPTNRNISHLFQRQAIPMVWDFAEANILEGKLDMDTAANWVASSIVKVTANKMRGVALQNDARQVDEIDFPGSPIVSTDPPYYDNIGYSDLSDFFYVWLRRTLRPLYPKLFSTMLTPKATELIASQYRENGSGASTKLQFQEGFELVFSKLRKMAHPDYPLTIYYAFKQEEVEEHGRASTGWETMLEGLMHAGLQITGTLPVRTTKKARSVARDTNALASAIVLVCRALPENAVRTTRGQFLRDLKQELPEALRELQHSNIAPVDLAQASIGPGMAVFSRYREVLETDGSPMTVRTALALINQVLDEFLTEQEGAYDADTRWALAWYEQHGFDEGKFGVAETLSKAKNTSVQGLANAGILTAGAGSVRLLRRDELDADWDPAADARLTVWEATQHLIRALEQGGESEAALLLVRLRAQRAASADAARDLAYRLFALCERKQRATEALAYNTLIVAWPQIEKLAQQKQAATPVQSDMFE